MYDSDDLFDIYTQISQVIGLACIETLFTFDDEFENDMENADDYLCWCDYVVKSEQNVPLETWNLFAGCEEYLVKNKGIICAAKKRQSIKDLWKNYLQKR